MAPWLVPLAVPVVGLGLLVAVPALDLRWQHNPSHFLLVLAVALVSVGLGALAGDTARRRRDARLVLVSLGFMAAAGFLGLHALATPDVLLENPSAWFVLATPIGLLAASILIALSALEPSEAQARAIVRLQRPLGVGLVVVLIVWAVLTVASAPPLDDPIADETADTVVWAIAAVGLVLYAFAALRYLALYRRRRAVLLIALVAAFVLLAEAMLAIALSRSWHLSWWEWHLLMAVAFGIVAIEARAEYRRHGSPSAIFGDVYLEQTLQWVDRRTAQALERLVAALAAGEPVGPVLEALRRDGVSPDEARLLERSAREIHELDETFRPYLSPHLAKRLRTDPALRELGGDEREVSVLFADLEGFTAFSERHPPTEVIGMLNRYWSVAVPRVLDEGGTIERFAGDAIMAVFNITGDQHDHALRAARAGLALQRSILELEAEPDWPRFRVGINTGPAVVGNVGSAEQRSFTAIGDTTNVAARLQAQAQPGQIVLGATTYALLANDVQAAPTGALQLKGKTGSIDAWVLIGLAPGPIGSGGNGERGN